MELVVVASRVKIACMLSKALGNTLQRKYCWGLMFMCVVLQYTAQAVCLHHARNSSRGGGCITVLLVVCVLNTFSALDGCLRAAAVHHVPKNRHLLSKVRMAKCFIGPMDLCWAREWRRCHKIALSLHEHVRSIKHTLYFTTRILGGGGLSVSSMCLSLQSQ
jgi:hypothetical protein